MSKLLHLINRLKAQANIKMLTASQAVAYDELSKRWRFPDRINLCGSEGSGKTFLGWVMARESGAYFYPNSQTFEQDLPLYSPGLIIDNAPTEEKKLRRLLSEIQLRQVQKVLLITQKPIKVGFPIVTLIPPTEEDIAMFYKNLNDLNFYAAQHLNQTNFWTLINSAL